MAVLDGGNSTQRIETDFLRRGRAALGAHVEEGEEQHEQQHPHHQLARGRLGARAARGEDLAGLEARVAGHLSAMGVAG